MSIIIPPALVIVGPTASGKTALSEALAQTLCGEIINADVGQFYAPLTIGTAKPAWHDYPWKSHLFDIVDSPGDINIMHYRSQASDAIKFATRRGHVPIVVGGSLFYLKSLFFPPHELPIKKEVEKKSADRAYDQEDLWGELYSIDPERALALHHHDTYRIKRALDIWEQTGVKPSAYKPQFNPVIRPLFVSLEPSTDTINQRIDQRTQIMLAHGWIDEAQTLLDTAWEEFLSRKQLIGYHEIFQWLRQGEKAAAFDKLVKTIQVQTRQYAKRQRTFWRGLIRQLDEHKKSFSYRYITLKNQPSSDDIKQIKNIYEEFCR